jgi:hypothetical protein
LTEAWLATESVDVGGWESGGKGNGRGEGDQEKGVESWDKANALGAAPFPKPAWGIDDAAGPVIGHGKGLAIWAEEAEEVASFAMGGTKFEGVRDTSGDAEGWRTDA